MRFRVTGPAAVAGVTPGGVVELGEDTNVAALVQAGHVQPVDDTPAAQPDEPQPHDDDGELDEFDPGEGEQ